MFIVSIVFSQRDLGDSTKPVRMEYKVPDGFELTTKEDTISVFKNGDKATIKVTIGEKIKSFIEVGFLGAFKITEIQEENPNLKLLHLDNSFTIDSKDHLFVAFDEGQERRVYFLMTKVHDRLVIYKLTYLLQHKDPFESEMQGFLETIKYFF